MGLYQSVRLHGTICDHFFFGPGLERKLTIWTSFSERVIAHGRHLLLSFYLPPSVGLLPTIWTRFSVRVIAHGRHLSLSFYLPPSGGLLLTIWTRFSLRVIAHGRHLSLSFYVPPGVGLLLTIWTRFFVRVYDRAWKASFALFFVIYRRASAYDRLHISTTTIHTPPPKLKQYHTAITPLASKQYSTCAVTMVPFSCLPREAPFLREIRTLRQVAHIVARIYLHYGFCAPRQHGSGDIF